MPEIKIKVSDENAALIDNLIMSKRISSRREFAAKAVQTACDKLYLEENVTALNEHIVDAVESVLLQSESRLGNRFAKVFADAAIELGIMNQLLAQTIDVTDDEISIYRKIALDHISTNGKVLRYKDLQK